MATVVHSRWVGIAKPVAWLPLILFPLIAVWITWNEAAWLSMWTLAFSLYAGLKWLSFVETVNPPDFSKMRALGYLLLWPGMDAKSFLANSQHVQSPRLGEWISAAAKTTIGFALIGIAISKVGQHPLIAGWTGMVGIVFVLHFGMFHMLSVLWRNAGVEAPPLMNAPLLASSLNDFWGNRWNLAFRDLAHAYLFRPCAGRWGIPVATMAVFVVSGLIHDLVISLPARAGYGLPTLYFAIQGVGVLFERSRLGRRLGMRHGALGRIACAVLVLAPVGLLFHPQFVERVIVPMLRGSGS